MQFYDAINSERHESGWFILNNVGPYTELVSLINHFSFSEKLHLAENTVFLKSSPLPRQKITGRSSRPEMSVKKGFSKILLNMQENTRDRLFLRKFQAVGLQLYWKRLQHSRFPESFAKFSGIRPKIYNIFGRLLLDRLNNQFLIHRGLTKVWNTHEHLDLLFLMFFNIQYPLSHCTVPSKYLSYGTY